MAEKPLFQVDRELCIGSGLCLLYAPGTFSHDDEAKVIVIDPAGDPEESIRTAVEACPTRALSFIEQGDG